MRASAVILIAVSALAVWVAPASNAWAGSVYRNEAFKFTVSVPSGWQTRIITAEAYLRDLTWGDKSVADHGVDMALPGLADRTISVAAGVTDWVDGTPGNLLHRGCRPRDVNTILDTPAGLAIARSPSRSCRFQRPDGRIEVLVGMRKGAWRGQLCRSDIGMHDYLARLETTREYYEADLERFRAVLKTMRVFMPAQKFTCTRRYRNEDFGFSVRVPPRRPTCTAAPYQNDHGITVYLDHGVNQCTGHERRPHIHFGANYDAIEAKTPREWIAQISCDDALDKVGTPPASLRFAAKDLVFCTIRRKGWIDIELAGASPWVAKKWGAWPFIIYSASLHTTPARLKRDLATFRVVLRSVRLFKPDGDMQRVE
jgi:hypothetical protein